MGASIALLVCLAMRSSRVILSATPAADIGAGGAELNACRITCVWARQSVLSCMHPRRSCSEQHHPTGPVITHVGDCQHPRGFLRPHQLCALVSGRGKEWQLARSQAQNAAKAATCTSHPGGLPGLPPSTAAGSFAPLLADGPADCAIWHAAGSWTRTRCMRPSVTSLLKRSNGGASDAGVLACTKCSRQAQRRHLN